MDTKQQSILEKDISELFGFSNMTDEERAELLDDIGSIIMESATLRFMVEGEEAETKRFEELIEANAESEDVMKKVLETFPRFEEIVREEIVSFKEEASDVLA